MPLASTWSLEVSAGHAKEAGAGCEAHTTSTSLKLLGQLHHRLKIYRRGELAGQARLGLIRDDSVVEPRPEPGRGSRFWSRLLSYYWYCGTFQNCQDAANSRGPSEGPLRTQPTKEPTLRWLVGREVPGIRGIPRAWERERGRGRPGGGWGRGLRFVRLATLKADPSEPRSRARCRRARAVRAQGFGAPSAHRPPKEALLPWEQALGSWPGPGAQRAHGQRREPQRRLGGRRGAAVGRAAALRRAPLLALPPGGAGASDRRVPGPVRRRGERQRDDGALIGRYRDMRTTTSLYLGSMAVSDLLILLGLPFDLYRLWRSRPWVFGTLLCRLSLYVGEGCTYATLLHMTALSLERYLAICRPLRARVLVTCRRVRAVIAALWAVALLSAGPFFFLVGVEQDPGRYLTPLPRASPPPPLLGSSRAPPLSPPSGPEAAAAAALFSRKCRPRPAQRGALCVMLWVTTAYFFLTFLCLSVLYGLIGRELWRSRGPLRGPATSAREKGHQQTVRVLLVVVLAFIVCWLPFHAGRIIYINTKDSGMIASINPILYNLISKKYRAAAWKLLLARGPDREVSAEAGRLKGTLEETWLAAPRPALMYRHRQPAWPNKVPHPTALGLKGKQVCRKKRTARGGTEAVREN
uniref:G-protein coupled receptors family 1 profile domain-containing protein n=1 Tax=Monodon monoceros TaxID=40151 RepID=A0A8C6BVV1_MONMO